MTTSTPAAGRCPSGWSSIRTRRRASSGAYRCATTSRSRSPSSASSSSTASEVRAAGRRGAGAPPAEARLQIGKAMPRIPFQKPKKVEWEILSDRYGRLVAEPFEKGYALTVGNSLRRTLLAVVPGAAVSWVRIDGVKSAEAKIPGASRSEEHTSELQSRQYLVCRLLLEKKNNACHFKMMTVHA